MELDRENRTVHTHRAQAVRARSPLRREDGLALGIAIVVLAVLVTLGGIAIAATASNTRSADRSIVRAHAVGSAESGLNLARSTLWAAADPTNPAAVPATTVALGDGTITYGGTYDAVAGIWTLYGTASVASENPGAAPYTKKVSSQVQVTSGQVADENTKSAWSTLFVDDWATCTEIEDNAVIGVEMYVRGDLCMQDNSAVTHEAGKLQVWGKIRLMNSATVGTAANPVPFVHTAGGCRKGSSGVFRNPCTPADSVYAGTFSATPENLTMPPMNLAHWYANAKPGPMHPCTVGSLPPGVVFDSDTTVNNSTSTFALTTAAAYDCQYWEGGELVGRLAWSGGTTGKLTVHGTIFFDGDIHVRPNAGVRADYDGQATLYTSGEIEVQEDVWLCGVATCDGSWDPNTDLLVLVADGGGWHEGIDVEYAAKFQGGAFSLTELDVAHGGEFWGSAITRRVEFVNGTTIRHIPGGVFPVLDGMPQTTTTTPTLTNVPSSYSVE